eukprot:CAMPEP_0182437638 /NCGR_PEP_ID=MMETSP1167-20130531/85179_1 /TAXON_ID=2988 /ORGANISM="Mallomonas Sp, Strain CCMP3275" /LENGTH=81 /DNA_ID=CAMNT_0024630621 /DNA_START=542 /DNA_END=784 /DNA_ORIENTATION=-
MTSHLRTLLPRDFSQLDTPLAVGVYERETRKYELVTEGDLCEAVTASCAIPVIFQPVKMGSSLYADGGVIDRTGIEHWAEW